MPSDRDPLALDPEQMRELGYRVVDLLVDRERRGLPALPRVSREVNRSSRSCDDCRSSRPCPYPSSSAWSPT